MIIEQVIRGVCAVFLFALAGVGMYWGHMLRIKARMRLWAPLNRRSLSKVTTSLELLQRYSRMLTLAYVLVLLLLIVSLFTFSTDFFIIEFEGSFLLSLKVLQRGVKFLTVLVLVYIVLLRSTSLSLRRLTVTSSQRLSSPQSMISNTHSSGRGPALATPMHAREQVGGRTAQD